MIHGVIFKKELKRNRKNWMIWTSIVLGFTLLVLSIYPSFSQMGDQMSQLMSSLPEEYARAFGMDAATWQSITGFYGTYYGIYITLLMGIFTASTAATIIGKEERDGTAEFLLTRPVSRSTIVWTKVAVLMTLFLMIYAVQAVVAVLGMNIFGDTVDWDTMLNMHIHGFFLVLLFTAIGMLLSSFLSVKLNFMGPIVGIIFGSFFLDAISKATEAVDWLGYFSPYHYLNLAADQGVLELNPWGCVAFTVAAALMIFISHGRYMKKDIAG